MNTMQKNIFVLVLALVCAGAQQASATYRYDWLSTSGHALKASFTVDDATVQSGVIPASAIQNFIATTSRGVFNELLPASVLSVDPQSGRLGGAAAQPNQYLTADIKGGNTSNLVLLAPTGWNATVGHLVLHGRGHWRVTYVP